MRHEEMTLAQSLTELQQKHSNQWSIMGIGARPNLHSLLRYPAMMVPSMQGDLIEALSDHVGTECRVADTFVGSGTTLTESLVRGLDFVGYDINPLAVLVCDAKIAIDHGLEIDKAAGDLLARIADDHSCGVDVSFPGLSKWFSSASAQEFSRIRRAISGEPDVDKRKVFWTVFAETIRLCSNSRTSTYKLHIRREDDYVPAERVRPVFSESLAGTLSQVSNYRQLISQRTAAPDAKVYCGDVRSAELQEPDGKHTILVTSPPYGDNQTTIPYGQFSYLALQWIPLSDLRAFAADLVSNTHSMDSASLGGSRKNAADKAKKVEGVSPSLDRLLQAGSDSGMPPEMKKVASFMSDFYDALQHAREVLPGAGHWVFTTGNRRAGGQLVPFDTICEEMLSNLGARPVVSLKRTLPTKRMPSKNNIGDMITAETTLVVEFA